MAKPKSLREQLAAKRTRHVIVPVQVSDPGPARSRVSELEKRLTIRQLGKRPEEEILEAETELAEARAELAKHFVDVEFRAIPPADFEALQDAHTTDDGTPDPLTFPPVLAAACAVDEDLRDEEFWVEQLSSGAWAWGERHALFEALLNLNLEAPPSHVPKG